MGTRSLELYDSTRSGNGTDTFRICNIIYLLNMKEAVGLGHMQAHSARTCDYTTLELFSCNEVATECFWNKRKGTDD